MHDLIGRTLGHYRIVEKIGEGGMGEVYRSHDERLDRDVAVKVLPDAVAGDEERLARFEREAKLLASLNHPNIATLHGLEEEDGRRFLVMELVEGEDLAGVLARGAIPFDEAIPIALQIATALETAHEHGIIHRDLKPANLMVGSEGQIKVLDFGLAKAFDPEVSRPQSPESIAESPTLTAEMTRAGVLLGTAAYMSPEQARGKVVDKRADIWAFGCVLYELLTGTRPFSGATSTEFLAAIIKDEPDWDALPAETPGSVRRLLRRCLTKDPRDRFHDIADVRIELQSLLAGDDSKHESVTSAPVPTKWRPWLPWSLAIVFGLAVGASVAALTFWNLRPTQTSQAVTRFDYVLPVDQRLNFSFSHMLSLSPDGTRLVYSANDRLYLRRMDRVESSPIRGTEGYDLRARSLCFSADGEYVGFWADGKLRKIQINGGSPITLCDIQDPLGESWGADDVILFGQGSNGIWKVSAVGGPPEQIISVDAEGGEFAHGPQMLPDGNHVLFTLNTGVGLDNAQVVAQSLETGERHLLISGGTDGRYLLTGHLVFVKDGTLFATAFNSNELEVSGIRVPMVENVRQLEVGPSGGGQMTISRSGTLAYQPVLGESSLSNLVWVDRQGRATVVTDDKNNFGYLSLSPDGQRAAVTISAGVTRAIWVYDLTGNRPPFPIRRGGCSWDPVWTPDGKRIIFSYATATNTTENLYWVSVDGGDIEPELLHAQRGQQFPYSISPDGKDLFYADYGSGESRIVFVLDLTGESDPRALLNSESMEPHAAASPNKRWIAFTSNRTGRDDIWVASYPELQQRQLVSFEGGSEPRWSHDGRELYYRAGDKMMFVPVTADKTEFRFASPQVLFEGEYWGAPGWPSYGVAPDGRFLMIQSVYQPTNGGASQRIQIVLNWFEELKRLAPTE